MPQPGICSGKHRGAWGISAGCSSLPAQGKRWHLRGMGQCGRRAELDHCEAPGALGLRALHRPAGVAV